MSYREIPFFFEAQGATLLGIASVPRLPIPVRLGVVIAVGGPQYRVGSHRQFVLLARALADAGIACLRFDYRGMGDSDGPVTTFTAAEPDLRAAIDAFFHQLPSLERVILWGLCDGASACAFYAAGDPRVAGLALYNPWVRTESGEAKAALRHYYARRLLDKGFWRKFAGGRVRWRETTLELWRRFAAALVGDGPNAGIADPRAGRELPSQLARGIERHQGPILIALSGNDMVAAEFKGHIARIPALAAAVARRNVSIVDFAGVDHTFSRAKWRDLGAIATIEWLRSQFETWLQPAQEGVLVPPEVK